MWELFQKILKANLSPNQSLILFGMKQKISLPDAVITDRDILVTKGYIELVDDQYVMTAQAKVFCATLDSYFIKAKKKTDIQLMGKDADYLYMQTSQYFICKQDKHKVKHSRLADYCDMIADGVSTEDEHFKENVV